MDKKGLIKIGLFSGVLFGLLALAFVITDSDYIKNAYAINETNQTGNIYVTTTPTAANVHLDSIFKGLSAIYISNVSVGNHTLLVTKIGYWDISRVVSVNAGQTTNAHFNLTIKCTDTDRYGYPTKNPNINGTATAGTSSLSDYCEDAETLVEYYCQNSTSTTISSQLYSCVNSCNDGACQ